MIDLKIDLSLNAHNKSSRQFAFVRSMRFCTLNVGCIKSVDILARTHFGHNTVAF